MREFWHKVEELWQFLCSRAFALSMIFVVLAFVVFKISTMTNAVYLVGKNNRTLTYTTDSSPERILRNAGLAPLSEGEMIPATVTGHFMQLAERARLRVTLTCDGVTSEVIVSNGLTVGELLYDNGIRYDGNDLLTPAAAKPLEDRDHIILNRVEYEKYVVEQAIPYQTVRRNSPLIRLGTHKCIQTGADGTKDLTFVRRTVDGVREDVQLLGEHITRPPVTEKLLIGSVEPVSNLDFNLDVDENGRPLSYSRVLHDQVATGYSARPGATTASGRYAIPGHVAVDPREIPYGSKLYIVSADNRFIYGCAVAADTGTGLMADIVDIDLFYETYAESVMNGRRIVDIYVLN